MKKFLLGTLGVVIIGSLSYFLSIYFISYSDGYRAGELVKFSHKGVIIKTWERKVYYSNYNAIKSFLYKSVRNRCLDYLKSKHYRSIVQSPEIDFDNMLTEEFFHTQLTIIDTYSQLETAIKKLPNKCEQIIRLSLKAYTIKEIAQELAISKNTVKSQKRIAYEKLRHSLSSLLNIF